MPLLNARLAGWLIFAVLAGSIFPAAAGDADFPYGSKLVLDETLVPGARRIPIIRIAKGGLTKMDLRCISTQLQAKVSDDSIEFGDAPGSSFSGACQTSLDGGDLKLMAYLLSAKKWSRQGDNFTLILGENFKSEPKTSLLFRIQK